METLPKSTTLLRSDIGKEKLRRVRFADGLSVIACSKKKKRRKKSKECTYKKKKRFA